MSSEAYEDSFHVELNPFRMVFDVEPVAWARARTGKGFFFTPQKQRDSKETLRLLMKSFWKRPPLEGPISVSLIFSFRRPKGSKRLYPSVKPDIDNLEKQVFDSGNGIIWKDDNLIVEVCSRKEYGLPFIQLEVREL